MRGSDIIRDNAEKDPKYAPYCIACATMARMEKLADFYWKCRRCGAEHDERGPGATLAMRDAPKDGAE